MEPISFIPVYKDYVWGGNTLSSYRSLAKGVYAESWEIFDLQEQTSLIANGAFKGRPLRFLMETMGEKLLGLGKTFVRFPLSLKIIDAKENLSVQVHPSSGEEAKSEAWISLKDAPFSVFAGWQHPMTEEVLRRRLEEKSLVQALKKFDLHRGDLLHVPQGVVHAISSGGFLLEIQNNASTTFRLYDWERNQRTLHVEEALREILWEESPLFFRKPSFFASPQFSVSSFTFQGEYQEKIDPSSFLLLFFEEGEGRIATKEGAAFFRPYTTFLLSADSGAFTLHSKELAKVVKFFLPS